MGIFSTKCKECSSKTDVQPCPYCKKDICYKCLNKLVLRDNIPEWLVGKKVKNYDEFKKLYDEYCSLIIKKGSHIHCCDAYLEPSWAAIIEKVRKIEKNTQVKAKFVILK